MSAASRTGKGLPAEFVAPMKALGSERLPTGTWHCEIKYDGYRAVAVVRGHAAELWSRTRKPMGADYPAVVAHLGALKCRSAVLDGEVVALDPQGRSRFQLLQNRGHAGAAPTLVYYLFDVMRLDGRDLTGLPLEERRNALVRLVGKGGPAVQVAPAFAVEPAELFAAAAKHGLEGIIAKRPGSLYEPDRRSGAWRKCKVIAEQEFVIGGFSAPRKSREYFGALLVGYYAQGELRYAGKVGTGFDRSRLASIHARFLAHPAKGCPFVDLPSSHRSRFGAGMGTAEMRKVTWVKPVLVAQVKFAEWTAEGLLRQPVFLGLREDKKATAVRREAARVSSKS
jgi:bifunctional non-homologous end joining protein LigD